jgi:hypothetical protein
MSAAPKFDRDKADLEEAYKLVHNAWCAIGHANQTPNAENALREGTYQCVEFTLGQAIERLESIQKRQQAGGHSA